MVVPTIAKLENLQSSQCLWRNVTDYVQLPEGPKRLKSSKKEEKKPPAGKVQLYSTQNERLKLRKWMGTVRWTYNQCLIAIEKEETPYSIRDEAMKDLLKGYSSNFVSNKKFKMKFRSKKDPRQSIVIHSQHWGRSCGEYSFLPKIKSAKPLPEKLGYDSRLVMNRLGKFYLCMPKPLEIRTDQETPYSIRDEAMKDLLKGYSSNFVSNKKFKMKFRSKKDPRQSIVIHSQHWGRSCGEYSFLPKIKSAKPLPEKLGYDSRLVMNRLGKFYLCMPKPLEIRTDQGPLFSERQEKDQAGSRCTYFKTGYDPSGIAIEWEKNDIGRIYRLSHKYDKLQSKLNSIPGKKKQAYTLRRVMLRINKKIRCLVDDCHYHHNYQNFARTQGMIRRGQRRIRSKSARAMCTWSHYRSRQHLINKAREHPWCQIVVCTEEYTSKTCGSCGYIHKKLGGSKEFCCPQCKTKIDRDINGARNILLKYLTKKESAGPFII
ncbi:hypothetical protein Glove_242g146 [Diversispora epigaea]|uniref:Transposase putative helix-turn-helix domain-containing protein n=1 Tax=Diversispora epigaea TaxID=1348612 RepID=A0A397I9P3_9GLOM|nr:hypothetical protein Glove_242g146 [Diversispora epigaea]